MSRQPNELGMPRAFCNNLNMNIHLDGFGTFKSLDVLKELFA